MKTYIIHDPERRDRNNNVADLCNTFDNTTITHAIIPKWDENNHSKTVRGCSLSHLKILEVNLNYNHPVLILEDDAIIRAHVLPNILSEPVPNDCGAIIMGGDVVNNFKMGDEFYLEILSPFFGTQAVWYNMTAIAKTPFILEAYKLLASEKIGNDDGGVGLCLESILMTAMNRCGLKIYRPRNMLYSTIESFSDRTQTVESPNVDFLDV